MMGPEIFALPGELAKIIGPIGFVVYFFGICRLFTALNYSELVAAPNIATVVIAASGNDCRNMIIALKAKRVGIPQAIAIIHDTDYISLLK